MNWIITVDNTEDHCGWIVDQHGRRNHFSCELQQAHAALASGKSGNKRSNIGEAKVVAECDSKVVQVALIEESMEGEADKDNDINSEDNGI